MNNALFNEIVSPIGLAWNFCLDDNPSIQLYSSDGMHPSPEGSYLAASTIFSTVFKTDPANNTFTGGLDDTLALYLRQTGYNTVITDSVYIATNLPAYTPEIEFNPDEISTSGSYSSYQWVLDNSNLQGAVTNPYTISISGNYSLIVTDINGCRHRSFGLFCDPLYSGLLKDNYDEYSIFPNPAKDYIIISPDNAENLFISLYDNMGILLKETSAGKECRLDISDLKPGIYYLKINNPSQLTRKIVVAD